MRPTAVDRLVAPALFAVAFAYLAASVRSPIAAAAAVGYVALVASV